MSDTHITPVEFSKTVEIGNTKLTISDFEVIYHEDTYEEGRLDCEVIVLDGDGEEETSFSASCVIGFSDEGASLYDRDSSKGLDNPLYAPQIKEVMEEYLELPGVKEQIIADHLEAEEQAAEFDEDEAA